MENKKLKRLLQKLFENREFEMSFTDSEPVWDGDEYVYDDIVYNFKFHIFVSKVIGKGSDAVGDLNIIIDEITKDGEDFYYDWFDQSYSEHAWYIRIFDDLFVDEYLEDIPFSIYRTYYGYDE